MGCFWLLGKGARRWSSEKLAPTPPPFLGPAFHWTVRCVSSSRCEHLWTWGGTVTTQSLTFRHREGSVQVPSGLPQPSPHNNLPHSESQVCTFHKQQRSWRFPPPRPPSPVHPSTQPCHWEPAPTGGQGLTSACCRSQPGKPPHCPSRAPPHCPEPSRSQHVRSTERQLDANQIELSSHQPP